MTSQKKQGTLRKWWRHFLIAVAYFNVVVAVFAAVMGIREPSTLFAVSAMFLAVGVLCLPDPQE